MLYEILIRNILWGMLIIGIWLVFFPFFNEAAKEAFQKRTRRSSNEEQRKEPQFIQMTQRFLAASAGIKGKSSVYGFYALLFLVSVFSFTTLQASNRGPDEVLSFSFVAPGLIVLFLYYRLHQSRVRTSHEGKHIINELLNNYRIYNKNIIEALDQTVYSLKGYPNARSLILILAIGLKEYKNEEELREVVNEINYRINSKWGILLANLIFAAERNGDDITEGLIDLSKDLAELDQINEKNKQLNLEGSIMIKFLIPAIFLGGLYLLFSQAGFTIKKYIEYQFVNDIGFTLFYYSMFAIATTILVFLFMKNEKNDF